MSRILLLVSTEAGHLNPMVGVAQCLARAGHQVSLCPLSGPALSPRRRAALAGIELLDAPRGEPDKEGAVDVARLSVDPEARRHHRRRQFLEVVPRQLESIRRLVREVDPEVIAGDATLVQGRLVSEVESRRYAAIGVNLALVTPRPLALQLTELGEFVELRKELLGRYGIADQPKWLGCPSPWLNTVFTVRELVGEVEVPDRTVFAGPSLPVETRGDEVELAWERLRQDVPLVYVSFGTVLGRPDLIKKIVEAAAPLNVQLLIAGDLPEGFLEGVSNVVVSRYAPQLAVLQRAAVFVTHGGANSVMEALGHGVPMLVVPISAEQPIQAHFLQNARAGLCLRPEGFSVEACRRALEQLLAPDGVERRNTLRLQAAYRGHDGARNVANAILRLCQ